MKAPVTMVCGVVQVRKPVDDVQDRRQTDTVATPSQKKTPVTRRVGRWAGRTDASDDSMFTQNVF